MNTYSLESFINFCDDMMIAEEGINVKDIGKAIIKFFEQLLDKVTEFILKCTKNKLVYVDTDFATKYGSICKDIDALSDEIDDLYSSNEFMRGKYKSIESLNDRITELNKMSASRNKPDFTSVYEDDCVHAMNTYEIFKDVTKLKDRIRTRIRYIKDVKYDDFDSTEEDYDKLYLKICECKLRLYQTVYSKIKDLK